MATPTPRVLIFDDAEGCFGPLTRRRAACELRTGATTTKQRIEAALGVAEALFVADELAAVAAERHGVAVNPPLHAGPWLCVNGRWNALDAFERVADLGEGEAVVHGGAVVAARLDADAASRLASTGGLDEGVARHDAAGEPLYRYPWDVLRALPRVLPADLGRFDFPALPAGHVAGLSVVGEHAVRVHPGATVLPPATFDASTGPIVIDAAAELRPFVAIQGPAYVGPRTVVGAFTSLRPHAVLGPECRVGGELSHAVVQGYTNKAHAGYLGNAFVGEWCNLGADTTVSNLKNTYGTIRVTLEPGGSAIDTGLTHQGPVLGDVVRTAIGTRVPTGACLDLACSVASSASAPKHVPPFSWVTDAGREAYGLDRLIASWRHAMSRRSLELSDAEESLLRALHARHADADADADADAPR